MRILHITPYYYPSLGGAEVHARQISERLARRGHEVAVLTINGRGSVEGNGERLSDEEVIHDVAVQRFRPADRFQALFNGFLNIRGAHRLLGLAIGMDRVQMLGIGPWTLRAYLSAISSKADVVSVSNWYCGTLASQTCLARRHRKFALVGIPFFHTERYWSRFSNYGRMLARCDAVVALTEHERGFIAQRSARDNVHVVGVGVDPATFVAAHGQGIRDRFAIGDAPVVGYVGRMTAVKGVATLINAMKQVWRTNPAVRLLLAGSGLLPVARQQDEIARAFADLSETDCSRIIVIDRFGEDEKASIFDALDLFVMPSVAESFGIAYLEAWLRRKPVIGARIGATQCVIEDGVDGVLVTPESSADLAGSILRLLSEPATRQGMGRAGYSKTMARFTWDAITDQIEHIYEQAHTANQKAQSAGSLEKLRRSR